MSNACYLYKTISLQGELKRIHVYFLLQYKEHLKILYQFIIYKYKLISHNLTKSF